MSALWLLPLAVGAAGAGALALANRKLAREVEALRRAGRPGPARSDPARSGPAEPIRPLTGEPER